MSSSYRLELNKWLAELEVKADTVLDIGGAQEQMPGRVKSWDVKKYLIADLPNPHKDSPKPDIELDLNEGYYKEQVDPIADLVFCLEVFDYVYDPMTAFQALYDTLKPGGQAWVTFPSFYPLHNPIEDDALRYMEGGIRKLAKATGFTIEEIIKRRPETTYINTFWAAERMRAAKHQDHEFTGYIVRFSK